MANKTVYKQSMNIYMDRTLGGMSSLIKKINILMLVI